MVINTNIAALNSARYLTESSSMLNRSLSRLSSGSKITSPEDDAGGLAVSIKFDAQIRRIGAAQNNIQDTMSFSQTQDGFLQKVGDALNRMSELSVMSMDETKTDADRALYGAEFTKLGTYVTDLGTKDFNGVSLFNGTAMNVTTDADAHTIATTAVSLGLSAYTTATSSTIGTTTTATTALTNVKAAITQLATDRANVGANLSVLSSYNDQLSVLKDNTSAANSRIKDVDVAQESTSYARYNILVQAGTAMLSQANQSTQSVMRLISG
ncbi:MAG TPA: flagellin [Candidatus Limnocylindria bacterium]|jgi:flagellin|nr:flagellin [Candidatus Limnocylindria bacterium]